MYNVYTQRIAVDICRWKGSRLMINTWEETLNLHSCRAIVIVLFIYLFYRFVFFYPWSHYFSLFNFYPREKWGKV